MALVIGLCRKLDINLVLESGRARGQSTYLLGKYLPEARIESIEREWGSTDAAFCETRLRGLTNVRWSYGDSRRSLPSLANAFPSHRIAILLDGPKGNVALDLMQECFAYPNVMVGFIHDMRKLDHGQPSDHRVEAEKRFPKAFYSDDPAYVEMTRHLDAHISEETGWKPYHIRKHTSRGDFELTGSYGPTIGVFFNRSSGQAEKPADAA